MPFFVTLRVLASWSITEVPSHFLPKTFVLAVSLSLVPWAFWYPVTSSVRDLHKVNTHTADPQSAGRRLVLPLLLRLRHANA